MGIMEENMETTTVGYIGFMLEGLFPRLYRVQGEGFCFLGLRFSI